MALKDMGREYMNWINLGQNRPSLFEHASEPARTNT
jgi:hypothetical protein